MHNFLSHNSVSAADVLGLTQRRTDVLLHDRTERDFCESGGGYFFAHGALDHVLPSTTARGPRALPPERRFFLVLPMRRGPRSANDFITIGRLDGNDVCIPNDDVSRFHAFVRQDAAGVARLFDAGSKNGTLVEGVKASARDGPGCELRSGARISFATVDALFLRGPAAREALGMIADGHLPECLRRAGASGATRKSSRAETVATPLFEEL